MYKVIYNDKNFVINYLDSIIETNPEINYILISDAEYNSLPRKKNGDIYQLVVENIDTINKTGTLRQKKYKVHYDKTTKKVKGYYPEDINYNIPNDIIEIEESQWTDAITKNMIVENNALQEESISMATLLLRAKEKKKNELYEKYKISKLNAKFILNGEIVKFLSGGLEEAITELQRRIIAINMVGIDLTIRQGIALLSIALNVRHITRTNVEICQNAIDLLDTIELVENYTPNIEVLIPEINNINELLL